MDSGFEYISIDQTSLDQQQLAAKYRDLRLLALQQSPDAFSSTYEQEAQYSIDDWVARLFNLTKKTFICVDKHGGVWAGQVSVLGPISADAFRLQEEAGQPEVLSDDEEERWQMTGLYTLPSYRGKGLGKELCKVAFKSLAAMASHPNKVRVRIMVKPQNTVTVRLYQSLGFVDSGRCTLEEALTINGEHVPENPPADKYRTRAGYIMEHIIIRQ